MHHKECFNNFKTTFRITLMHNDMDYDFGTSFYSAKPSFPACENRITSLICAC